MNARAAITVIGFVQGVGFRWFTHKRATELGLLGYVKNLDNGNVYAEVEGNRETIDQLIELLKSGPRFSKVSDVMVNWKEFQGEFLSFEITH
ncbi:acylphosphatase [bacterium]|nr:acylphosphatase [bacterium]